VEEPAQIQRRNWPWAQRAHTAHQNMPARIGAGLPREPQELNVLLNEKHPEGVSG
jgi:hypothetical protein